jgi:nucleoside-diphosphate-sugar epimerase
VRVVIAGATGNVGSSLVEALAGDEQVDSVVGLSRRPAAARRNAIDLREPAGAGNRPDLRVADVSRDRLDEHLEGADALVHLAWLYHPARRPSETWRNNVIGATRSFTAAARAGVTTIAYVSSVAAYSPAPGDTRVTETWPTHSLPTAGYGREKAYVERLLDVFERDHPGIRVVRLRPTFAFKHAAAPDQRRLLTGSSIPRLPTWRGRPFVPCLPGLRFQALHTDDLAEALRLSLHRPVRGPFNIACDPVLDLRAMAEEMGATPVTVPPAWGRPLWAAAYHARLLPIPPAMLDLLTNLPLLDTGRARGELHWRPAHDSMDALRELLAGLHDEVVWGAAPPSPTLADMSRVRDLTTTGPSAN